MMYGQGHRPSDLESISSQTSDVTSRATTISDSTTDTISHIQQKRDRVNVQPKEEDRSSTAATSTGSVNTVISKDPDAQRTYNNQFNQTSSGNKQQQPWVNPYWGPNGKSNTAKSQSETNQINNNANTDQPPSSTLTKQLIPGSILINEQGGINDLLRKQNSLNPGAKLVSDNNSGPGGYLAPEHIQRHIVISPPGLAAHPENQFGYKRSSSSSDAVTDFRPTFTRQQTFPQTSNNNIQPWVNPYWPNPNQTKTAQPTTDSKQSSWNKPYSSTVPSVQSTSSDGTWKNPYWKDSNPQTSTPSKPKNETWKNPYWKDSNPQTSTPSNPKDETWKNPYWKDWKPQNPTVPKSEDKPWKNPYWEDQKPQGCATSSQQQDKSWQNPYWKDKNISDQSTDGSALNKTLSFANKGPLIPSFYERIYPPYTPLSLPVPTIDTKNETMFSTEISKQNINDDEDLPYTIDSQGTAHYRATFSSPSSTNKTVQFVSPPTTSQYPGSPPTTSQYPGSPPTTSQYPGSPPTTSQYPGSPPTTSQYPGSPPTTSQYPGSPPTTSQYPGSPPTTSQYPGSPPTTSQYPGSPPTTSQYPGSPPTTSQYPGSPPTTSQYPGSPPTTSQYPGSPPTTSQYPGSPPTTSQYPGSPPTTSQYPGSPPTTSQYPGSPPTTSQYPGSPSTTSQYPGSPPTTSQYPVSSLNQPSASPPSQTSYTASTPKSANTASFSQTNNSVPPSFTSNITSPLLSSSAKYQPPPSSFNYSSSPSSSSPVVLTEADFNSIQHALQVLSTNSNYIPVIETPNQVSSSSISRPDNYSSSSSTGNQGQQPYQQGPVPSSNTTYPDSHSSPLASLFSGNREQQAHQQGPVPSTNTAYLGNRSPPLVSLFTDNRGQQSHQQQSLPSSPLPNTTLSNPPYSYDPNSQQLTVFSTSSYPSQSNKTVRHLVTPNTCCAYLKDDFLIFCREKISFTLLQSYIT